MIEIMPSKGVSSSDFINKLKSKCCGIKDNDKSRSKTAAITIRE